MQVQDNLEYHNNKDEIKMLKVVILARDFSKSGNGMPVKLLEEAGFEVEIHEQSGTTDDDETIALCRDADAIICATTSITEKVLAGLPKLKFISRRGIGMDTVDMDAVKRHGIEISRTVGVIEGAVAELTIAYILEFGRSINSMDSDMKAGKWNRVMAPGVIGKTIGLVGFGGIGQEIAKRAEALGMNILYYSRHKREDSLYGAEYASFDELLRKSDFISVNVPLTEETTYMFGKDEFAKMKSTAYFINISRGKVVDDKALAWALEEKKIAGAGIDVFEYEPCTDSPLKKFENAILTPHIGGYTEGDFNRMNIMAAKNLIHYFSEYHE